MAFYTSLFAVLVVYIPAMLAVDVVETTIPDVEASTEPSTGNCTDAISTCAQYVNTLCKRSEYTSVMYQQCRSTCGMCSQTTAPCVDADKNCPRWNTNGYCASSFYTTQDKKNKCAKTCNLCPAAPISATNCIDVNRNCATWNLAGFCTNKNYSDATKKASCAKTCNLCK